MFRCPTCISVLTDPNIRRCQSCREQLRRRRPRVLGEEYRIGARLLPIDRAMNERLHGGTTFRIQSRHADDPWEDRFRKPAPQTVTIDEAPAPTPTFELPAESTLESAIASATLTPAAPETVWLDLQPLEQFDRRETREVRDTPEPAMEREAAWAPVYEPLRPGPLDPDVQALVDDLYQRARSEIVGTIDTVAPDEAPAPALEAQPTRRRGWVPAVLTDRKRNDATGGNGNGRHLDDQLDT